MLIKSGTLDFCYCKIEDLHLAIDRFKSKYQAKETIQEGKDIKINKDKKVVIYKKNNNNEYFICVNSYKIIN